MSIPGVECPEGKCNYESLSKYFESTFPVDVISGKNLTDPWQMCFVKLNIYATPVDPVIPEEDSGSKWWIALVVLIPVIIIAAIGIWYYTKKKDEKKKEEQETLTGGNMYKGETDNSINRRAKKNANNSDDNSF